MGKTAVILYQRGYGLLYYTPVQISLIKFHLVW